MRIVLIPTVMELLENMKNLQELWLVRIGCVSLEELYLSHRYYENGRLEDLWHNDNNIASLKGLAEAIAGATEKLTTIYLE
ncbi:hypothetical protein BC332_21182 [Capsicum chinense]|nr:hypothetical protein BC332_21182 [Capsicum chinense]